MKKQKIVLDELDSKATDKIYQTIKKYYCQSENTTPTPAILELVEEYGYLPVPFEIAQKEISNNDLFSALEVLFSREGIFFQSQFTFTDIQEINPLTRLEYNNSNWLNQEQLKIESLTLTGLCSDTNIFRNFLLKILTAPEGNDQLKLPATTFYLLPPYKRDQAFLSAYCPISREIDPSLCDRNFYETTGWDEQEQFKLFILFANLTGHPVLLDLLPQTGRFSKTIFCYPDCFLWMDLRQLVPELLSSLDTLLAELPTEYHNIREVAIESIIGKPLDLSADNLEENFKIALRQVYYRSQEQVLKDKKSQPGSESGETPTSLEEAILQKIRTLDLEAIYEEFQLLDIPPEIFITTCCRFIELDFALDANRISATQQQMTCNLQRQIQHQIREHIEKVTGQTSIDEWTISDEVHNQLIRHFIDQGLWPVAGGCWNSTSYPIFDRMNPDSENSFPITNHYNHQGNIVSAFAGDMDIVAPWSFSLLDRAHDSSNLNEYVMEQYISYCLEIYNCFRPNGFRIDHIDHSADYPTSINEQGNAISYRAPLIVFSQLSHKLQVRDPNFTILAEYMGWGDDNHPHLYHQYAKNNINTGISLDIVGEYRHNALTIIKENNDILEKFNHKFDKTIFSLCHVMDNHDRSHPDILKALSEFTVERARLKWVKCLFLPGGKFAERPTMYLDGNQTHTPNSEFAKTFLDQKSLLRNLDYAFFATFDSLLRYSLANDTLRCGKAQLIYTYPEEEEEANNRITSWWIKSPTESHAFLLIAKEYIDDNFPPCSKQEVTIEVPESFAVVAKLTPPTQSPGDHLADWLEAPQLIKTPVSELKNIKTSGKNQVIQFTALQQNEFHIYALKNYEK